MKAMIFWLASWPAMMPLYITSSETMFAPASIIGMRVSVEATVTAIWLTARCADVGLMTYSPSTRPTETPEIGPFHGISEMESAMLVPTMPAISGAQSWSTLITVQTTETSFRMSFGKSGRIGRSITRLVRIALSVGRPSRFKKEPGILPTEYSFSSKSTESGKKSTPSRGFADAVTATWTTVSP